MKIAFRLMALLGVFLLRETLGQNEVPTDFRVIGGRHPFRVTRETVKRLNSEARSTNRLDHIHRYTAMLANDDVRTRLFAVWALGDFQSPSSLDALFAQATRETNPEVICSLADSIGGIFPFWTGAETFEMTDGTNCAEVLKRWAEHYKKHGYLGIFETKYEMVKGHLEGEGMFVSAFAEQYAPDLIPLFRKVSQETSFPEVRTTCEKAIRKSSATNPPD
jgi:hypothetical protein